MSNLGTWQGRKGRRVKKKGEVKERDIKSVVGSWTLSRVSLKILLSPFGLPGHKLRMRTGQNVIRVKERASKKEEGKITDSKSVVGNVACVLIFLKLHIPPVVDWGIKYERGLVEKVLRPKKRGNKNVVGEVVLIFPPPNTPN